MKKLANKECDKVNKEYDKVSKQRSETNLVNSLQVGAWGKQL